MGLVRVAEPLTLQRFVLIAFLGLGIGFFFERSSVWMSDTFQRQMIFADNTMLKFFLSAAAFSSLSVTYLVPASRSNAICVERKISRGFPALIFGGLLVGAAMTLGATCPGTVWIQMGAQSPGIAFAFFGQFFATIFWAILSSYTNVAAWLERGQLSEKWSQLVVPKNRSIGSIELFFAFLTVVGLAEWFSPHIPKSAHAWHPALCGAAVGLLQALMAYLFDDLISLSVSFNLLGAKLMDVAHVRLSYFEKFLKRNDVMQLIMYTFVVIGAAVSHGWKFSDFTSFLFETPSLKAYFLSAKASAFWGGFISLIGTRIAAGCPSSHGFSGMGCLATPSFIAVASMFGGAIGIAVYVKVFLGM